MTLDRTAFGRSPLGVFMRSPLGVRRRQGPGNLYAGAGFALGFPLKSIATWDKTAGEWLGIALGGQLEGMAHYRDTVADPPTNHLYMHGQFTSLDGGTTTTNNIARFDGVAFHRLGTNEPNGTIQRALSFAGELYTVGAFTTLVGGAGASRIAKWNGSTWSAVGSGMNAFTTTLCEYAGDLIIGGTFTTAGGSLRNRITRWNGSTFADMDGGLGGNCNCAVVYGSNLIAGGNFTDRGTRIAQWSGSSWSDPFGAGLDAQPRCAVVWDGNLYVGGDFANAGGSAAAFIARWNGSSWSALGTGLDNAPDELHVHDGQLIACGNFTTAGGVTANGIAAWDGATWTAFDSGAGTPSGVRAIATWPKG